MLNCDSFPLSTTEEFSKDTKCSKQSDLLANGIVNNAQSQKAKEATNRLKRSVKCPTPEIARRGNGMIVKLFLEDMGWQEPVWSDGEVMKSLKELQMHRNAMAHVLKHLTNQVVSGRLDTTKVVKREHMSEFNCSSSSKERKSGSL